MILLARKSLSFLRNTKAASLVEFALVFPVFFFALLGMMDFGLQFYAQHILSGAVHQAARKATLEIYVQDPAALDATVTSNVRVLLKDANVVFERKAYSDFSKVKKAEPYTDTNNNNQRDAGECYSDINGSGNWENDMGKAGNGGADDVILYTASTQYKPFFPFWTTMMNSGPIVLSATTVLRNQPYAKNTAAPPVTLCN